jgi:hypothetical protein
VGFCTSEANVNHFTLWKVLFLFELQPTLETYSIETDSESSDSNLVTFPSVTYFIIVVGEEACNWGTIAFLVSVQGVF